MGAVAEQFDPAALAGKEVAALAHDWIRAKGAEEECKRWRLAVEEALDAQLGHKEEGAKTTKAGFFSITLTGVLNRKMDWEAWDKVKGQIPTEFQPVKRVEELDTDGVKWLQENRPDLWKVVAQAVTIKPGKTGCKVVRKEE